MTELERRLNEEMRKRDEPPPEKEWPPSDLFPPDMTETRSRVSGPNRDPKIVSRTWGVDWGQIWRWIRGS